MRIVENRPLLFGIGMLIVGGLITAGTYGAASGGGSYVIATGLLAVGGLNLIRGLYYQVKYGAHRDESLY